MSSFEDNAKKFALKAIDADRNNDYETAILYYLEASQCLINAKIEGKHDQKVREYLSRAETLKQVIVKSKTRQVAISTKTQEEKDIETIVCLLNEALNEDQENNFDDALELYMSSIELYLKRKSSISKEKLNGLEIHVKNALKRAEEIKTSMQLANPLKKVDESSSKVTTVPTKYENSLAKSSTSSNFTQEELNVLRHGSFINEREYVPFLAYVDSKEKFYSPIPFKDKDGLLVLSSSQREKFKEWTRPNELFEDPKLITLVSSFSIKQTCISDCSFVASLTVCAQYERKFGKKLLASIIYPKNKYGEPVYNPCGKYMIAFNINGCQRKVIVDDLFPIDKYNNMLCSMTTNKGELWVSLLEKAYMKVMGGYNFPGSNSNIDLHALTSWIPERLSMHNSHETFNENEEFERLFERFHLGQCLITVATGALNKQDEERTGLVATHAYACLDLRKFKSQRLFQLKNPWSHIRWKGNYSELDTRNWTQELKLALNFDPNMACNVDNGVFWIDYESLMKFFDVIYISWNPSIFPFTSLCHRKWSVNEGPARDRFNFGVNPQYVVSVKNPDGKKYSIWILLTRHIVDKADFAQNKEYITLVVYKNNGKLVYYPNEPEPFKDGIRINSPHYLVKLTDDLKGLQQYTLVISQYEKSTSLYYTLKVYSTISFNLNELKEPYKSMYTKELVGKWCGKTAGGCSNNLETYKNNPLFHLEIPNNEIKNCIKIELKGPQQYSIGFEVVCMSKNVDDGRNTARYSSGDYRKGFCMLCLDNISGGKYQIRPSTFLPNQEGPFFLACHSSHQIQLTTNS